MTKTELMAKILELETRLGELERRQPNYCHYYHYHYCHCPTIYTYPGFWPGGTSTGGSNTTTTWGIGTAS